MPVGVDIIEPPMMFELEKAGLKIVDGQQVMLEARELKNIDEIALLNRSAAMVDGAYHLINEELKPGIRENDIVAKVNEFLYRTAPTTWKRSTRSRRALQPAPAQFHRPHAAAGRPGVLRHPAIVHGLPHLLLPYFLHVGRATPVQHDAYKKARVARQRDRADQAGRDHRQSAQRLAEGARVRLPRRDVGLRPAIRHGLGLALHERPIISRVVSLDHPTEIKEGMVFALETYCPAADGYSAARIEEEVVVTDKGCRVITLFPAEELPISHRY